jgi:hypothetical protein
VCQCDSSAGYKQAGSTCFSSSDFSTYLLSTENIITSEIYYRPDISNAYQLSLVSDYVFANYYAAAIGCLKYKDIGSCQAFANLCVMNLYNENQLVCKLIQNANANLALPKLYYPTGYNAT